LVDLLRKVTFDAHNSTLKGGAMTKINFRFWSF